MKLHMNWCYWLMALLISSPNILKAYTLDQEGNSCTHIKENIYPNAQKDTRTDELSVLQHWIAGKTVSSSSIDKFGKENCFSKSYISKTLFNRIYKKSYKTNCTVPVTDLRYLKVLHYDIEGQIHLGELICHKDICNDLLEIFEKLYDARYPIELMVLIDNYNAQDELSMRANNTTCFNFRKVAGTKILSKHSTGHAIDINPLYNPYIKKRNGSTTIRPANSKIYADRTKNFSYKINKDDLCYRLFIEHGFKWGGNWKTMKDFQHFEK